MCGRVVKTITLTLSWFNQFMSYLPPSSIFLYFTEHNTHHGVSVKVSTQHMGVSFPVHVLSSDT